MTTTDVVSAVVNAQAAVTAQLANLLVVVGDADGGGGATEGDGTAVDGAAVDAQVTALAQSALNVISSAVRGASKATVAAGETGVDTGSSAVDVTVGTAVVSFTSELAESLAPHLAPFAAPMVISTPSVALTVVPATSAEQELNSEVPPPVFSLELARSSGSSGGTSGTSNGGAQKRRGLSRGLVNLPQRRNTTGKGAVSMALFDIDVRGNATDERTAQYFAGVVSIQSLRATTPRAASGRRLSEAAISGGSISDILDDGAATPLVVSFDASSLPTQGGGNCTSSIVSLLDAYLANEGDGVCKGGVCCENQCKCAPNFYGPYCEVRVDCGHWNATASEWGNSSCTLEGSPTQGYLDRVLVPGTDTLWANCSCSAVSEGDFTLSMFELSERFLPSSNVALDGATLSLFGARLFTTWGGWIALILLLSALGGAMARAHWLDCRFAQVREPPSWWIAPEGMEWSWVWRTRFHVRKKHVLFQLLNVVGGYSDLTRLHLTICLCNLLLCTWLSKLIFYERPSCFLEQQAVTLGISLSISQFIWLVGRELFRLSFRTDPFGLFSKDRVDEMHRQKTARPRSFRQAGQRLSSTLAKRMGSVFGRESKLGSEGDDPFSGVLPVDDAGSLPSGGEGDVEAPIPAEAPAPEATPMLAHAQTPTCASSGRLAKYELERASSTEMGAQIMPVMLPVTAPSAAVTVPSDMCPKVPSSAPLPSQPTTELPTATQPQKRLQEVEVEVVDEASRMEGFNEARASHAHVADIQVPDAAVGDSNLSLASPSEVRSPSVIESSLGSVRLAIEQIEQIRRECGADDIPLPPDASERWSEEDLRAYFSASSRRTTSSEYAAAEASPPPSPPSTATVDAPASGPLATPQVVVSTSDVSSDLPAAFRALNFFTALQRNSLRVANGRKEPVVRQIARRRTWRRPLAAWVPYDALHRIDGHWALVLRGTAMGKYQADETKESSGNAPTEARRFPRPSLPVVGSNDSLESDSGRSPSDQLASDSKGLRKTRATRGASTASLRHSLRRVSGAFRGSPSTLELGADQKDGKAGRDAAKGSVVVPVVSLGVHAWPNWVVTRWMPDLSNRLVVQVARRDLPRALQNATMEECIETLGPANLVGDGPLRRRDELWLLATLRQASWLMLAAWSFNLTALFVGAFFFLYSILIVFQDPDAVRRLHSCLCPPDAHLATHMTHPMVRAHILPASDCPRFFSRTRNRPMLRRTPRLLARSWPTILWGSVSQSSSQKCLLLRWWPHCPSHPARPTYMCGFCSWVLVVSPPRWAGTNWASFTPEMVYGEAPLVVDTVELRFTS